MRRRTLLAAALSATAGCSQLSPDSSGGDPMISAGDARVESRDGTNYPVVPLSHTAEDAVFSGVLVDISFLDGETVVESREEIVFAVPPAGANVWVSPPRESSFESARVEGVIATNPTRPVSNGVSVSNAEFGESAESDGIPDSRNLSARFENTTDSMIELYPYLVATYQGTPVLPANPGPDAFGVTLEAGEALQHEASITHPHADVPDGIDAYPCVSG